MKEKKYLVLGIALVLLTFVGVSLAYFLTTIEGERKNITINTADLRVIFTNGDAIEGTEIEPGWSVTKTFSVENKSKNEYKYNIVIEDLVNTFKTTGYLQYKITSTAGGGNGQLKYPIAMMTIDELSFAGGLRATSLNSPYAWYYTNSQGESIISTIWWWSLSPYGWYGSNALACHVGSGRLSNFNVQNVDGVRPSVSLASCVGIKLGNGTPESPYEIDYDNSCN